MSSAASSTVHHRSATLASSSAECLYAMKGRIGLEIQQHLPTISIEKNNGDIEHNHIASIKPRIEDTFFVAYPRTFIYTCTLVVMTSETYTGMGQNTPKAIRRAFFINFPSRFSLQAVCLNLIYPCPHNKKIYNA